MARAQTESLPAELLTFFRSPEVDKDRARFDDLLRQWFFDEPTNSWFARWERFVFPADIEFDEALFMPEARISGTRFLGDVEFRSAVFQGEALFRRASFTSGAFFESVTFVGGATFREASFAQNSSFRGADFGAAVTFRDAAFARNAWFPDATFQGEAFFRDAIVGRKADFSGATFHASVDFKGAQLQRGMFVGTRFDEDLTLGVNVPADGSVQIDRVVGRPGPGEVASSDPPRIRFDSMSLAGVEIRSFNTSELRFMGARDIEKLSVLNIEWHRTEEGYRIADERDLVEAQVRQRDGEVATPSWRDLERIYRALRKNHEDRNDRYGAHGWYYAEMEIGRRYADRRFTRLARAFYRATSGYGLSAPRAFASLLIVLAVAFLVFMVPFSQVCPLVAPPALQADGPAAIAACAGWQDAMRVVVMAVSLQGVPSDVSFPNLAGNAVWILARFGGAAMLVSIGVAFRNQIAR